MLRMAFSALHRRAFPITVRCLGSEDVGDRMDFERHAVVMKSVEGTTLWEKRFRSTAAARKFIRSKVALTFRTFEDDGDTLVVVNPYY